MKHFLRALGLVILLSATQSCGVPSFNKTLIVTGESLDGIGKQFVQVAEIYKTGCDVTKTIDPKNCAKFRSFGTEFQKAYPLNVKLWEAARSASDSATEKKVADVVTNLATSLSEFAVAVVATYDGGK
jgi:hypothetical protein